MHTVVVGKTQKEDDSDRFTVLEGVLEASGFWETLEKRFGGSGKTRSEFLIAIKPNVMMFYSKDDMNVITEPALVEHLIKKIVEKGYSNIALVESQNVYGNWFKKRDVANVAKIAGYHPGNYRIIDITLDTVSHTYNGPLGTYLVGKTWKDADFRISFAKNKTHLSCFYTLTIKNIYGTTPEQNKFLEYHKDNEIDQVTIEMLKEFPVHFGIVDGIWSSDGVFGYKASPTPKHTKTLISGGNLLAVDIIGGQKMGLDPMKNRFVKLSVENFGMPEINLMGDGSVYSNWENVPEGVDQLMNYGEEFYGLSNLLGFLSTEMDPEFPLKATSRITIALRRIVVWILKILSIKK